jgi:ATP phosphoribosyltransferase
MLTLALTKGRILEEALPLLDKVGIRPLENISSSRKLVFPTSRNDVQLVVLRGSDVPTYVEFGTADVAVAGKDVILEHGNDGFYEPLDLKIAQCRLMTAAMKNRKPVQGRLRVATKYVKLAHDFYAEKGRQVEIIKLYGAMELAPIMGFADEIVDIVDTGNTLKANGLEPLETIAHISSRLIINKASMKLKHKQIQELTAALAAVV